MPLQRTVPQRESVNAQIEGSRYRLGPIRLIPRFTLHSAGYVSNVFGTAETKQSDYTATVGLGTEWIIPFGRYVFLRGTVTPQYIWFARDADARKFGWVADNSLLLLFNRVSFEGRGNSSRDSTILNQETQRRVLEKRTEGSLDGELELTGHISLVGHGEFQRYRYTASPAGPPELADPADLDRDDIRYSGGFRYHFTSIFDVTGSYQETRSEFRKTGEFGDNRTRAYVLDIHLDRRDFFVNLSAGYRKGEPINGSAFPEYRTTTGSGFVLWNVSPRLGVELYGRRGAEYSVSPDNPYYLSASGGAAIDLHFGERLTVRGFGELGTNRYPNLTESAGIRRRDDVKIYGGGLLLTVHRDLTLNVTAAGNRYDSNIPGLSRSFFTVTGGLSLRLATGVELGIS